VFIKIKQRLPWWGKIAAKLVLSQSPLSYSVWQKLNLFRHGQMDDPGYASGVFEAHVERAGLKDRLQGMKILEIGPGDSIGTAIISKCHGARAILVDVGHFAEEDLRPYLALCELLHKGSLTPPDLSSASTLQDALEACDGEYLTEGLVSWRQIPPDSLDFVFSQAVLEHVPKEELLPTMRECRRVMKPGSIASHTIDLSDHLGEALNNLRFNEQIWESNPFRSSGFYTNRIRYSDMLRLFEAAGFIVEKTEVRCWDKLPITREKLALPFCSMPEHELCIRGFDVCLRVPDSL
jgi:hypothetical protein